MSETRKERERAGLHQLRQPLNVILLTCGALRSSISAIDTSGAGAEIARKLDRIEDQARKADTLAQALFEESDVSSGSETNCTE